MVPESKVFARFPDDAAHTLSERVHELSELQKTAWPALAKGAASLDAAEVRSIDVNGFPARLQWNPQRIISTAAKVDAASLAARRCFLCVENLPAEQQGILFRDDHLILCNPSPIFSHHCTVTHVDHRPQAIRDDIGTILSLSQGLGSGHVIFYNGPKCGASAPDHLHTQVVPTGSIPTEADVRTTTKKDRLTEIDGVSLWKIPFYGRTHCVMTGADAGALEDVFTRFLTAWMKITGSDDEPMLNLLSIADGDMISLCVFLRSKHRPDDYFKEAEDQVLVSPASVDMGGHVVTPLEKDFHAIDGPYIERMFQEVSAPPTLVSEITRAL